MIVCPKCGASGNENCSTKRGNDHAARIRAEVETLDRRPTCSQCRNRVDVVVEDTYGPFAPMCEPCFDRIDLARYWAEHGG